MAKVYASMKPTNLFRILKPTATSRSGQEAYVSGDHLLIALAKLVGTKAIGTKLV